MAVVEACVVGIAARPTLTSVAEGTARVKALPVQALETIDAAFVTAEAPQLWPMHCATAISQELVSHKQLSARQRQLDEEPHPQLLDREH